MANADGRPSLMSIFGGASASLNGGRMFAPTSNMSCYPGSLPGNGAIIPDKRNRNPNWTDAEIVRFLEILQEDEILKDLCAQRNKQVFCHVAQRLCSEGAEKTWDQCRIKLKNLKSQYRYVKERVPDIGQMDLEDDDIMKQLIGVCQNKGISPSSLKHLRYLRRFLSKMSKIRASGNIGFPSRIDISLGGNSIEREEEESVSPPTSPSQQVKIIPSDNDDLHLEPERKKIKLSESRQDLGPGQRCIEKFNQDMMEQFLEHQRRVQSSFQKWEMERQRLHESVMERWRSEVRDHEKVMFSMFIQVIGECNKTLTRVMKIEENGKPSNFSSISATDDDDPLSND